MQADYLSLSLEAALFTASAGVLDRRCTQGDRRQRSEFRIQTPCRRHKHHLQKVVWRPLLQSRLEECNHRRQCCSNLSMENPPIISDDCYCAIATLSVRCANRRSPMSIPHPEPDCTSQLRHVHVCRAVYRDPPHIIRRGAAQAMCLPEQPSLDTTNGVLSPDISQS